MSQTPRPWAPLEIAGKAAVRAKADQAVVAWSGDWFARARLTVTRWDLVRGDPWAGIDGVRVDGRHLGLAYGARAFKRLIERALDAGGADLIATDLDGRLTEAFARPMFEDLLARLEMALELSGPETAGAGRGARDGGVKIGVSDSGDVLLWLVAPFDVLMGLCRGALAPPRPGRAPLTSRRAALGDQPIALEAVLGQVALSLAELRGLAVGDVLVLDRGLSEPATIARRPAGLPLLHADLTDRDGRSALCLRSSPTRLS